MSLDLVINRQVWQSHMDEVKESIPGIVPVAKGNGYGFTMPVLVEQAQRMASDVLAVGVNAEVAEARRAGWDGSILVLNPWSPAEFDAHDVADDPGTILTVSSLDDLTALAHTYPGKPVVVEVVTSMRRFGIEADQLHQSLSALDRLDFAGWAFHFPLSHTDLDEINSLVAKALQTRSGTLWLSHIPSDEYRALSQQMSSRGVSTRLRVGTGLWCGCHGYEIMSQVLAIHPVRRGERVGYWQNRVPRDGVIMVLSGGTSHGVSMAAPGTAKTWRQRAIVIAESAHVITHRVRSPFEIGAKQSFLVEPPHMQCCVVFVPGDPGVGVGDFVPVNLRTTTARFDRVVLN